MKRLLWVLLVIVGFMGCDMSNTDIFDNPELFEAISLVDATQPFVDELGEPEDIDLFFKPDSSNYAKYWWYTKGICHTFIDEYRDHVILWKWYYSYTFEPIVY